MSDRKINFHIQKSSLRRFYNYGRQLIEQDDIDAVLEVLKSDRLTQGPYIEKFEEALGRKFGAKYVCAVSSGTAALHLTGLALGWKKGDIVITSPITFLASANCILYSGATPDFVDIDKDYYTIDVNKLEEKIKDYNNKNKKIKAVVGVDFAGQPCDWKALRYLADKYEFQLVNDNCHALGAKYYGSEKYALKYADVICHSYHPVKHITTGEGGAVLTDNNKITEKVKILRTHGNVKDFSLFTLHSSLEQGSWYYEMQYLGFNYRITDFQCTLGISQLKKLDRFVEKRRTIAKFYDHEFNNDIRFIIPNVKKNCKHSYHLYPLQINFDKLSNNVSLWRGIKGENFSRNNQIKVEFFKKLSKVGINCQVHYIPVHLQPYYRKNYGFKNGDFPIAEKFYEREISIPIYPSLSNKDLKYIANTIKSLLS